MFLPFFENLRSSGIPVSLREFLGFLAAMRAGLVTYNIEGFYYLARISMVKDERNLDKFDRVFAASFKGLENISAQQVLDAVDIPRDWLTKMAEKYLSAAERAEIEALGGFEALMDTLRQRLRDQQGRHQGGSKWIGTAGTSPFGAYGYNPEGVRIGQDGSRHGRAVKVWDRREFRNLDDTVELGTRTIKVALKRLRKWARDGAPDELDLTGTIRATADNAGWLDIRMRPERKNRIKVLLFIDIGGSMDSHVRVCGELFSAARGELKHLEHYYFHNFLYERVWRENRRGYNEWIPTWEILNTYGPDYKVIVVGDATMSPYEITHPGGSVEHMNEEAGAVWLQRVTNTYPATVWLNPVPEKQWGYSQSTKMIKQLVGDRMYPLTLEGLDDAMRELSRKHGA